MAATTQDRNTRQRAGHSRYLPLAAATKIPAGVIACLSATGLLTNGATSTTLKTVGVPNATLDNSAGSASALSGEVFLGVWGPFGNSAAGDQITLAAVGSDCYIVDNQTVALTNGTGTRSVAGKVFDVTAEGVWVEFR